MNTPTNASNAQQAATTKPGAPQGGKSATAPVAGDMLEHATAEAELLAVAKARALEDDEEKKKKGLGGTGDEQLAPEFVDGGDQAVLAYQDGGVDADANELET